MDLRLTCIVLENARNTLAFKGIFEGKWLVVTGLSKEAFSLQQMVGKMVCLSAQVKETSLVSVPFLFLAFQEVINKDK